MDPMNIVIIGSSAGGPRTLKEVFTDLPLLNGCIIVVQHMPKFINESLCRTLDRVTDMKVRIAQDGAVLHKGGVYVAPSEVHLELTNNRTIRLTGGEKVNFVRPSVDVTMKSVRKEAEGLVIGIVLTGMGRDGAEGVRHIKQIGGIVITQDKDTSVIYGMPREAFATGAVDFVLTPHETTNKLFELLGRADIEKIQNNAINLEGLA